MKYYIIAGEASGDLHGSHLIHALKKEDSESSFRVWGGDLMQAAGADLVKHYKDLAFMGFLEVVKNLLVILGNFSFCKRDILQFQPDVLVLIDYPGFNLRMGKWAKKQGFRVFYYISPQLWAWHSSRVYQIKKSVERMFVILPFEKDFYAKYGFEVDFAGHPLLDVVGKQQKNPNFIKKNGLTDIPIIALLPGSRKQEIAKMLELMLGVIPYFPEFQFVVAAAPSVPKGFYQELLLRFQAKEKLKTDHANLPPIALLENQTYPLLQYAKAALVTSGTATLETALFRVPQVVCYKGNPLSFWLARRLVKVPFISLVNLIAGREVVRELIQKDLTINNLRVELNQLLSDERRARLLNDYKELASKLGESGVAMRIARLMLNYLTGSKEVKTASGNSS